MTITIDTETGLPELPEGQFWRVTDYQPIFSGLTGYGAGHSVQIVEHVTSPTVQTRWRWFRWIEIEGEPETRVNVLQHRQISEALSEESILKTAIDLLESIEEARLAEEAIARLVGDYPPKKLEVSE